MWLAMLRLDHRSWQRAGRKVHVYGWLLDRPASKWLAKENLCPELLWGHSVQSEIGRLWLR